MSTSITTIREKYLLQAQKATDAKVEIDQDPVIQTYEDQISVWNRVSEDFSLTMLNSLKSCTSSFTSQQILNAYQNMTKKIENEIATATKKRLNSDCENLNIEIQRIINVRQLIGLNRIENEEFVAFLSKSKSIKTLVCEKVTEKLVAEARELVAEPKLILDVNFPFFIGNYCSTKDLKREEYFALKSAVSSRYKGTPLLQIWTVEVLESPFLTCDPNLPLIDLLQYESQTKILIEKINALLNQLQILERSRKIKFTISCKSGSKLIKKTGAPPKCPTNYSEVRLQLSKIL
jgi:hypothetical protein